MEIIVGIFAGLGVGMFTGRNLASSVARTCFKAAKGRYVFGLICRTGLLAAALIGSLVLGPWAWAGVAAGYLAGFAATIARNVRSLQAEEPTRGI